MHPTITKYFDAMADHDWDGVRACLSDRFERRGPYEEHGWDDPDAYVAFLRELLPRLVNQRVELTDSVEHGSRVHVNATETIEREGAPHTVRVGATFDLDPAGRIERQEVFVRQLTTAERDG